VHEPEPSVACPALSYIFILSHKLPDFENKLLNIKFVFWFFLQIVSEIHLIVGRNERDIIINLHNFHVNFPLFLSNFNET
jgi:hypothetical protein